MIHYKSPEEIELLRESSLLVGKTHAEVARHIKPGVTTLYLDKIAETFIRDHGAEPGFLNYGGFPNSLCMSVNEKVVHGIPTKRELVDGDIVSVDCGVLKNGYYGDSAYTYAVGEVSDDVKRLMSVTRESLYKGIEQAIEGNRMGDISSAVQEHAQAAGFSVVRELVGHGVGKNLHEKPEVPNYGKKGSGLKLKKGLVIAIEPMINMGTKSIVQLQDGWTIVTKDRKPSAHYEHMIAITDDKPDILSSFEEIEKVLKEQNLYVH